MCHMPRASHLLVMKNDTNVTKFVQCEAEYELRTMREVYWCLVAKLSNAAFNFAFRLEPQ
jgi:hypothetical protein